MNAQTKKRPAATCAHGPDMVKSMIAPAVRAVKPLAAIGWVCWLLMLGVVGGLDQGTLSLAAGIPLSFGLLTAGALALRKAGWLR